MFQGKSNSKRINFFLQMFVFFLALWIIPSGRWDLRNDACAFKWQFLLVKHRISQHWDLKVCEKFSCALLCFLWILYLMNVYRIPWVGDSSPKVWQYLPTFMVHFNCKRKIFQIPHITEVGALDSLINEFSSESVENWLPLPL